MQYGKLSRKHTYLYQVQTQLFTSSASYADFIIATFDGQQANINVERILPDTGFIEECIQKSEHFFKVYILPELLARWYSREEVMPTLTAAATTSLTTSGKYVYCYCKENRGGEMVGCDNSECPHGSVRCLLSTGTYYRFFGYQLSIVRLQEDILTFTEFHCFADNGGCVTTSLAA